MGWYELLIPVVSRLSQLSSSNLLFPLLHMFKRTILFGVAAQCMMLESTWYSGGCVILDDQNFKFESWELLV